MDRFDDGRSRKRTSYDDPRDTRLREHDEETKVGDKPQKLKNVKELMEAELALESGYKKEQAEITENGKLNPKSALLQMAQREELFEKMCALYDKYRKKLQEDFLEYRKSIIAYRNEKDSFQVQHYREGYKDGLSAGRSRMEEELEPDFEDLRHALRKSRILNWLCGVYGLIATAVAIGLVL